MADLRGLEFPADGSEEALDEVYNRYLVSTEQDADIYDTITKPIILATARYYCRRSNLPSPMVNNIVSAAVCPFALLEALHTSGRMDVEDKKITLIITLNLMTIEHARQKLKLNTTAEALDIRRCLKELFGQMKIRSKKNGRLFVGAQSPPAKKKEIPVHDNLQEAAIGTTSSKKEKGSALKDISSLPASVISQPEQFPAKSPIQSVTSKPAVRVAAVTEKREENSGSKTQPSGQNNGHSVSEQVASLRTTIHKLQANYAEAAKLLTSLSEVSPLPQSATHQNTSSDLDPGYHVPITEALKMQSLESNEDSADLSDDWVEVATERNNERGAGDEDFELVETNLEDLQ